MNVRNSRAMVDSALEVLEVSVVDVEVDMVQLERWERRKVERGLLLLQRLCGCETRRTRRDEKTGRMIEQTDLCIQRRRAVL